jgi:hypothetical protein
MPSVTRAVEVTIPEAEELADLYGIAFDLRQSKGVRPLSLTRLNIVSLTEIPKDSYADYRRNEDLAR